jgi:hypothetical protein
MQIVTFVLHELWQYATVSHLEQLLNKTMRQQHTWRGKVAYSLSIENDNNIYISNIFTGDHIRTITSPCQWWIIRQLKNGTIISCGASTGDLYCWCPDTAVCKQVIHFGDIPAQQVVELSEGKIAIAASSNIYIWNIWINELVISCELEKHELWCDNLFSHSNGEILVFVSSGTYFVVNTITGETLRKFSSKTPGYCVMVGTYLCVYVQTRSIVHTFNIETGEKYSLWHYKPFTECRNLFKHNNKLVISWMYYSYGFLQVIDLNDKKVTFQQRRDYIGPPHHSIQVDNSTCIYRIPCENIICYQDLMNNKKYGQLKVSNSTDICPYDIILLK